MNRDTCDICGISGDLEGHKCDPRKILKPVEDAEVQDWIKYKYSKANSYKSLGDALDIIERLARENEDKDLELGEADNKNDELRLIIKQRNARIAELEAEIKEWRGGV